MKTKIKIRIIMWFILLIAIFFLLYKGLVPGGKIFYTYDFDKKNAFISPLSPETRVENIEKGTQKIIANPVYFSLRTPRKFNKAKLGFYYRSDNAVQPIIESGVMVDKTIWRYDLKPLQNKIIDKICSSWNKLEKGGLLFCQKENDFNTIEDFLASTTNPKFIALYNYKLDRNFLLADYSTSSENRIINFSLRGAYQFYTYIKNETMNFDFSFVDINNNNDSDRIDLNVYYNDILIDTRHLDDDGNSLDNQEESALRKINLKIPNLPEGVYKIELRVNDDIITKRIESKQKIISFLNRIYLAKEGNENIDIYTDSKRLEATTIYPDSLQIIKVGNIDFDINESYRQFDKVLEDSLATSGLSRIILKKDGLILSGNGMFSFFENGIINPKFKKVDQNFDLANTPVKYILANYASPDKIDGWNYSEIEIDLNKAYRENRTYSFIISIPGLKINDKINDWIEIDKIKIELQGDSLFELIKKKNN